MGKCLKIFILFLSAGLYFGCAGQKSSSDAQADAARFRHSYEVVFDEINERDAYKGQKLVKKAHSVIGVPYVRGGSAPDGFDCSGFVKWAYESIGVDLPRTAREQSVVGKKIRNIKDMRAGDIVAFRHPKRGYHTGIYVGNGKFIHSPRKRTRVRINSLDDPYFSSTLLGARRVSLDGTENLIAQAESRLGDYTAHRKGISSQKVADKKSSVKSQKRSVNKKSKTVAGNSKSSIKKSKSAAQNSKKLKSADKSAKRAKSVAHNGNRSKVSTSNSRHSVSNKKSGQQKAVSMNKAKNGKQGARTRSHS